MIAGSRVLAVIPARGGSKGIPGKNIVPVDGRPLITWTINAARASRYIDRLILSSDDEAIMAVARDAGCDVPFVRASELSTDEASSIDVVIDALERTPGFDIVLLLQPTSPLRSAEDIDACLLEMTHRNAPACVSLRPAEDHPYLTFGMDGGGALTRFAEPSPGQSLRRQDLPSAWCLNGAVYAAHVPWLCEHRSFIATATLGVPMPSERSIDIDTPADLIALEVILRTRRS